MKEKSLLCSCVIIFLITALISGCISSDENDDSYDDKIEDLLITSELLPESWYREDSIDYSEMPVKEEAGYTEVASADFWISAMTEDQMVTSESLHQSVSRYDAEDIAALADVRAGKIKQCIEEANWNDLSIEEVATPAVGGYSVVLKVTYIITDANPITNYCLICSKDDIMISFQYFQQAEIESLDINYLLNLTKNLTSAM